MTDGAATDTDTDAADALGRERRERLETAIGDALASRDAAAFVHVGSESEPTLGYCESALSPGDDAAFGTEPKLERRADVVAIGYDGDEWLARRADGSAHPAARLAEALADRGASGTVLTPSTIPHDAALYLENAGFELASTDVVARARAAKTTGERDRIAAAQEAASDGIRQAASLLAGATVESDSAGDRLAADGTALTAERLRVAVDEAIVAAGAFPAGNTAVDSGRGDDGALRPGEPIVVAVAPRGPDGYHGRLVRTFVVDSDGGRERRAHVAVTQAFRSSRAMLTAGPESVTAVEADLEAEIRAFGEDGRIETRVAGVGLEPAERPIDGADDVAPGTVVRLEAAVELEAEGGDETETATENGGWLRLADVLVKEADGVSLLESPSRSLEPTALLED